MFTKERISQLNDERLGDSNLKPALVSKVRKLIALAAADGHSLIVTQGFRSIAQQNALYAQGRTKPGKIVTNARGGQSNHNKGTAVDLAFVVNGAVTWEESLYRKLGKYSEAVGLKWGGNWKRFKDKPHVEL